MTYILVTNDDGVQAPGILALAQAMRTLGDVEVIAPATNQSSSGHKKTLFTDIPISTATLADGSSATAVSGSPADCVAVAALGVLKWPPKIVVSGINRGGNMGQDITYSGTVTAALEGAIFGVPALAVSLDKRDANTVEDYALAAQLAVTVARQVMERGLPPMTILNLNVPAGTTTKGLRLTRQGARLYHDVLERTGDVLRIGGPEPSGLFEQAGTDLWAVHRGYASLTPIHLDMTAHHFIADLAAWDIGEEQA
ncbi:MAG: 5'/3'-nucleotidase SurE [Chloroflexi bacterium]|nr:5'/3'-nucleotidase SurE [Chloroflexota bacterium]MCC6894808.1 5'/3'-nucleotidase SurE [Anaerolineae bacterium]